MISKPLFFFWTWLCLGLALVGLRTQASPVDSILEASRHSITKRTLHDEWVANKDNKPFFVPMDDCKGWPIELGKSETFTTAEYFGCTIIVLVGNTGVIIGHVRQESVPNMKGDAANPLFTAAQTKIRIIDGQLMGPISLMDVADDCQPFAYILGAFGEANAGPEKLIKFLTEEMDPLFPKANVKYNQYSGSGGAAGDVTPGPVRKVMVKWVSEKAEDGGTLYVYNASESPVMTLKYDQNMALQSGP